MKKYVNGKIIEMTEIDIKKRESRINNRLNSRNRASNYEAKVKELEEVVAKLLAQQNTKEAQEKV